MTASIWSTVQQNMPWNIVNFSINISTPLCLLRKVFTNDPFLNYQYVYSAFNQNLCSTWYLVAIGIPRMADILDTTTLSFFSLLINFHLLIKSRFIQLCPLLCPHRSLLVIPFVLIFFCSQRIMYSTFLNSHWGLRQTFILIA